MEHRGVPAWGDIRALKVQGHDDMRGLRATNNSVAVNCTHQTDANLGARVSFGDNRVNKVGISEDLDMEFLLLLHKPVLILLL